MRARGRLIRMFAVLSTIALAMSAQGAGPSAVDQLNEPGVEGRALAARTGTWDVTETVWATPDAKPVVTHGVAVRRMVGTTLEETLYPANDRSDRAIVRIDYLTFNRIEGRWNYMSLDARAPIGIMTANSFDRDPSERIHVVFHPFAMPGDGAVVTGQLLRMDETIETRGPDADGKDQQFILADGTGRKWLAHRYAYVRRAGP